MKRSLVRWLTNRTSSEAATQTKRRLPKLRIDTLEDRMVPSVVKFSALSYTVNEGAGTATIQVERDADHGVETVAYYSTSNNANSIGSPPDYSPAIGTLTFPAGSLTASFFVIVHEDTAIESSETIELALTNPSAGVSLDPFGSAATLTILDNDAGTGTGSGMGSGGGSGSGVGSGSGAGSGSGSVVAYESSGIATLQLAQDNGLEAADYFTSAAGVVGTLEGGATSAGSVVEFDFTDDGQPDATVFADANGAFSYTPNILEVGPNAVRARVLGRTTWQPLHFNLLGVELDQAQIATLHLANDTGASLNDRSTADGAVAGQLVGDVVGGVRVEFDLNGDETAEYSTLADALGSFQMALPNMAEGLVTVRARVAADGTFAAGPWVPLTYVVATQPDGATAQAQAQALAQLGSVGRGFAANHQQFTADVGAVAGQLTHGINQRADTAIANLQAQATAAQNAAKAALDALVTSTNTTQAAAEATANTDLTNALATFPGNTATHPFAAVSYPTVPDLSEGPQIVWDGPLPDIQLTIPKGSPLETLLGTDFENIENAILASRDQTLAGIQTTYETALTAAQNIFDTTKVASETTLAAALAAAQQQFETVTGSGSSFFTAYQGDETAERMTRGNSIVAASQTHSAELQAADQAHQQRQLALDNARNATQQSADQTLDSALQAAEQAKNVALQQAYLDFMNAINGPNGLLDPNSAEYHALNLIHMANLTAIETTYKNARADAVQAHGLTIAAANHNNARDVADSEQLRDTEKLASKRRYDQATAEAWSIYNGARSTSAASYGDQKFVAQLALERAKGQAQAQHQRRLADAARLQANEQAKAAKERDSAIAQAKAVAQVGIADAAKNTLMNATSDNEAWLTYQRTVLTNRVTYTLAATNAATTYATAAAALREATAQTGANAARDAEYARTEADLAELEARLAALQSHRQTTQPPKKLSVLARTSTLLTFQVQLATSEHKFQWGVSNKATIKSHNDAEARKIYEESVAVAAAQYERTQNATQYSQAVSAAWNVYQQALVATTVAFSNQTVQLDGDRHQENNDAITARYLHDLGNAELLSQLLAAEKQRLAVELARALVAKDTAYAQASLTAQAAVALAEKNAVSPMAALRLAFKSAEAAADTERNVADAEADVLYTTTYADRYVAAIDTWATQQGNTPWANYQRVLADIAHFQITEAAQASVTQATADGAARQVWLLAAEQVLTTEEISQMEANLQATTLTGQAIIARVQQEGVAKIGMADGTTRARLTMEDRVAQAGKTYEQAVEQAEKQRRLALIVADATYAQAITGVIPGFDFNSTLLMTGMNWARRGFNWVLGNGSPETDYAAFAAERQLAIANAEKASATTIANAYAAKVQEVAAAMETYYGQLLPVKTAASQTLSVALTTSEGLVATAQRDAAQTVAAAAESAARQLTMVNYDYDEQKATNLWQYAQTLAATKQSLTTSRALALGSYYQANLSAYEASVATWATAHPGPGAVLRGQLVDHAQTWATTALTLRQNALASAATAEYDATMARANEVFDAALAKTIALGDREKAVALARKLADNDTANAKRDLAIATAAADAAAGHSLLVAQANYDLAAQIGLRQYDWMVANAGKRYALRMIEANYQRTLNPQGTGYEAEAEAARRERYSPATASSLGTAHIQKATALGTARIAWATTVGAAERTQMAAIAAARETSSRLVAEAKKNFVQAERNAVVAETVTREAEDVTLANSQATRTVLLANTLADVNATLFTGLTTADATQARSNAEAEADYHIAGATIAWQTAQAAALAGPTTTSTQEQLDFRVADTQFRLNWLTAMKPRYATFRASQAQAAGTARAALSATEDALAITKASAAQTQVGADTLAVQQRNVAVATALADNGQLLGQQGANLSLNTISAETTWFNQSSAAATAHGLALQEAAKIRDVVVGTAWATWQAGEQTEATQATWIAARDAADLAYSNAEQNARVAKESAYAIADADLRRSVLDVETAATRAAAQDESARARAVVEANRTLELAKMDQRQIYSATVADAVGSSLVVNAEALRTAGEELAAAAWDFRIAEADVARPHLLILANTVNTPFAQFLHARGVAEFTWRTNHRASKIATATAIGDAGVSRATALETSLTTYAEAVAEAGVTADTANLEASRTATLAKIAAKEEFVFADADATRMAVRALIDANEDFSLGGINVVQRDTLHQEAIATYHTTIRTAQVAARTEFTQADYILDLEQADIDLSYAHTTIDALAARATSDTYTDALWATVVVQEQTLAQEAEATARANQMTLFAAEQGTPWAAHEAALTQAALATATALAEGRRVQEIPAIQTARDKQLEGIQEARAADHDQANVDWAATVGLVERNQTEENAAPAGNLVGMLLEQAIWYARANSKLPAATHPGSATLTGPNVAVVNQSAATHDGWHGDREYDNIVARMSGHYSLLDTRYYTKLWDDGVAAAETLGYTDPISMKVNQYLTKALGTTYLQNHEAWEVALAGSLAATVDTLDGLMTWIYDLRDDLLKAVARQVTIMQLLTSFEFTEAFLQESAFLLGLASGSMYTPVLGPMLLMVNLGFAAADFMGVEGDFMLYKPDTIFKEMGDMLHSEAFRDGREVAWAVDLAIDIALEIVTFGGWTGVMATKYAVAGGAKAAKVGAKGIKAAAREGVSEIVEHADDLAGAARQAAKHVDEVAENAAKQGRRGAQHADNVGNGVVDTAAKAIPEEATKPKNILDKIASFFIHNDVTKSLGIHDELTAFANKLGLKACFAAGTPLLTPDGSKPIEEFKVGDLVLSRSEFDPNGPIEAKVVEELFRRTAPILHVHVGGQVIRTTGEHPFFVEGKGWIPASAMVAGDRLLSHDGQTIAVEEVFDTGEWETVYNMRVADWHTYFVGSSEWGFSVWSHNLCDEEQVLKALAVKGLVLNTSNITESQKLLIKAIVDGVNEGTIAGKIKALNALKELGLTQTKRKHVLHLLKNVYSKNVAELITKADSLPIHQVNPYDVIPSHKITKSAEEIELLKRKIASEGFKQTHPIAYVLWNEKKYLVDGHHRLRIAKELGLDSIPAIEVKLPFKGYRNYDDLFDWERGLDDL